MLFGFLGIIVDFMFANHAKNNNRFSTFRIGLFMKCEDIIECDMSFKYSFITFHGFDS